MRQTRAHWRVGDAGHTVFGPPNGTPSPEIIANIKRKGNAHLIAASPDMLSVLEEIILHHDTGLHKQSEGLYDLIKLSIRQAKAGK